MKKKISHLELAFEQILKDNKIKYKREYKFHPTRKWRFDFLIGKDIAVELEGGLFTFGRHARGSGIAKDMEKYNNAILLGYKVLRYHNLTTMHEFLAHYKILK